VTGIGSIDESNGLKHSSNGSSRDTEVLVTEAGLLGESRGLDGDSNG
jgi:hypothetical protein